ncbi:Histidine protein kinase AsgD [Minicystis rosea]|nr:Histidine protein kinase AsgD [Minicystis rosea]
MLEDPSVPEAGRLSEPELYDHIPIFIDELVSVLEAVGAGESTGRSLGGSVAAREHARQRRESGYSLLAALRELSHFRSALIEVATASDVPLDGEAAALVHAAIDQSMITGADEMEQAILAEHREDTILRERFIGVLGHDLRTPLTTIMVAVATMRKGDGLLPEDKTRLLDRVTASTERMARLIGDLLDVTRLRLAGRIPITPQPIDLVTLVRSVVEEQQSARADRVVTLEADESVRGTWDPDRMVQVLANLLSNALDYSLPDTPVRVTLHRSGAEARLSVHNQGPPIPAHAREHLFDPYYQGPQSGRSSKRSSFGLGLFITEQIVTAHGGSIGVTSSAEDGTTFHVRLPGAT